MEAFSVEKSINSAHALVKELFDYIRNNADASDAYAIEREIQRRVMDIGKTAMESYFAEKGTVDVGEEMVQGGAILKRQTKLRGRDYFFVFGEIKVPRTYYCAKGCEGAFPLDAEVNFPKRCYSYLLQEYAGLLGGGNSFGEASVMLEKVLGIDVESGRAEVTVGEAACDYDEFYRNKETPEAESEGEISVAGFDGKGVPMTKKEAAKLTGRKGKGKRIRKRRRLWSELAMP